ncbi:MAG: hypothetical protein ACKO5F_16455 [Synechococcus sp.]
MTTHVLLTHHHRQALTNACERGFWMPLPISAAQGESVGYLTALSPGSTSIRVLAEVTSLEPWRASDGREHGLFFLGRMIPLLRPVPLGDPALLEGWLPCRRDALQLLPLEDLLRAQQLTDLLLPTAACCPLRLLPGRGRHPGRAPRRRDRAA